MAEFYHVSRSNISEIEEFKLEQFEETISAEGLFSAEEFTRFKLEHYPNGISHQGEIYLHDVFKADGPNLAYSKNEYLIETTFELIRRLKFPERKSRFECSYGCLNIEDAKKILAKTFNNVGVIYKVQCEKYTKADMTFLNQAGSVIGIQIIAEKYWSGKSTKNPFWEILMENPVKIIERIDDIK